MLRKTILLKERTGQKADPIIISKNAMQRAEHSDSSSVFKKEYFLAPQEMTGYFLG